MLCEQSPAKERNIWRSALSWPARGSGGGLRRDEAAAAGAAGAAAPPALVLLHPRGAGACGGTGLAAGPSSLPLGHCCRGSE